MQTQAHSIRVFSRVPFVLKNTPEILLAMPISYGMALKLSSLFNSLNVGMEWNEMKWNEQVFELLYNFYILLNSSLRQHVDLKTPLLHFNFARKIVWSAFQTAGLIQFISSQAKFQPTMNEQNNMYAFKAWQQSYCNRSSSSYAL